MGRESGKKGEIVVFAAISGLIPLHLKTYPRKSKSYKKSQTKNFLIVYITTKKWNPISDHFVFVSDFQNSDHVRCLTPKTPDDHEWWCPYGIQIEIVPLPESNNGGGSRKSSTSSRKSSQSKIACCVFTDETIMISIFLCCSFRSFDFYSLVSW